ncbi:MAG: hypothetical protein CMP73_01055 [Flavobacteriales bacterium]|nr:hypothetical protein [Flavobacteriales bacterium]|tara:strand:- start:577 stop:1419 length:843 start_codon:yes stop_codon:yes gene_type:complete
MTEELNIRQFFTSFVKFIVRNNKLIYSMIIIGVLSVIIFQKFKTPYYETKAICMSGISKYERVDYEEGWLQRTAIDLINYLEINIENKDYNELAYLLGIDISVAQKIKKIEAEQLFQKDMNEEFFSLNKFEVMLVVFDNNIISEIQEGLLYYFNSNNYVKKYYEEFIESSNKIILDINQEMKLLEKIRIEGSKNRMDFSSSLKVINGQEKSEVSNQIVALSQYREDIRTQKELLKPLSFVQDFAKVNQKEDDILIWSILVSFLSFLISLFVALIKEIINN